MNNIQIKLTSFDYNLIDKAVKLIVDTVKNNKGNINGPLPLKTSVEKRYTRILEVLNPDSKTIESLMHLNLPNSVHVNVKSVKS